MIHLKCPECNDSFEINNWYFRRQEKLGRKSFCSRKCSTIFSNRNRAKKKILRCSGCGKEKEVLASDWREKYCSKDCYFEHQKDRISELARRVGKESSEKISNTQSKRFVDGLVRPSYHGGYYFSQKNNKQFYYRSSWEKAYMEYLEKKDDVNFYDYEFARVPYLYKNNRRWYVMDFLINKERIVEIKPLYSAVSEKSQLKFESARNYCKQNNMTFEVLTEKELKQLGIL